VGLGGRRSHDEKERDETPCKCRIASHANAHITTQEQADTTHLCTLHTKQDARGSCPRCFSPSSLPGRGSIIITCPPAQLLLAPPPAPVLLLKPTTMTADPEPVVLTVLLALATFYLLRYVGGVEMLALCRTSVFIARTRRRPPSAVGQDDA